MLPGSTIEKCVQDSCRKYIALALKLIGLKQTVPNYIVEVGMFLLAIYHQPALISFFCFPLLYCPIQSIFLPLRVSPLSLSFRHPPPLFPSLLFPFPFFLPGRFERFERFSYLPGSAATTLLRFLSPGIYFLLSSLQAITVVCGVVSCPGQTSFDIS